MEPGLVVDLFAGGGGASATLTPPAGRRAREEWLRSLPVEERVRFAFGDDEDGERAPETHEVILDGTPALGTTCYFPGCEKPRGKGRLCHGHFKQRERGTPLRPLKVHRAPDEPAPPCIDCGRGPGAVSDKRARGRCSKCHRRLLKREEAERAGRVYVPRVNQKSGAPCLDCGAPSKFKGRCARCYAREYDRTKGRNARPRNRAAKAGAA